MLWLLGGLPFPEVRADPRSPVGTNLNQVSYWSPELVFQDLFKQSMPWMSSTADVWSDGRTLDLDEHGWVRSLQPGQLANSLILRDLQAPFPTGEYTLLHDGVGEIGVGFSAAPAVRVAPGRLVFHVPGNSPAGILISLRSVDPADPLRNIRIFPPGAEPEATFRPDFLAAIAPYAVLRFMDWGRTNDSALGSWRQRTTPESSTQAGPSGVAIEYMVDLANAVGADPWFTIPHRADAAFVQRFAQLVRARLSPERRVLVEYSNEVWLDQFEQSKHAEREAGDRGLDSRHAYYAKRSLEVFHVWRMVFGEQRERVVAVLSTQYANPGIASQILEFRHPTLGLAAERADALAIAPYFGDPAQGEPGRAPDRLIAQLGDAAPAALDGVPAFADLARRAGLDLFAYEGGQHLVGRGLLREDAELNALYDAANRHPGMRDVYLAYLNAWRGRGGGLFVHFNSTSRYTKWGRWGAREHLGQSRAEAPKLDALLRFIEEHAAPTHSPQASHGESRGVPRQRLSRSVQKRR